MDEGLRYRLALRTEVVGPWRFDLTTLEDLDATVDDLAERIAQGADPRWFEELCPLFGVIWPSARALAARIQTFALRDRSVLELGCGLALPSLVAARGGARVTATDQHPDVERFLVENQARNRVEVRYRTLDWGAPTAELPDRAFDLVLASDVLYARTQPELLAGALDRFLAADGVGLVADPGRPWLQAFADAARARGLQVHVDAADGDVFLLELRRG